MKSKELRIVYMGTPGFAVAPLAKMLEEGYNVVAVVTAPDRQAGRGMKVRSPEVKQFLSGDVQANVPDRYPATGKPPILPVLQPDNLKDPAFIGKIRSLKPDLQVVVAFRMLPEEVWSIPPMGTFNLHASLLPQYRGAAPIHHVILNGERETGVTTFLIDQRIDTGRILLQEKRTIGDHTTAGELHDLLMEDGAELVIKTINGLASGILEPTPQVEPDRKGTTLKTAPKIFRDDCRIRWSDTSVDIYNKIRGLCPSPAAFTQLVKPDGSQVLVKVYRADHLSGSLGKPPGFIESDGKSYLKVAAGEGSLKLNSLQLEGKRRMEAKEFLAGFSFASGPYRFS